MKQHTQQATFKVIFVDPVNRHRHHSTRFRCLVKTLTAHTRTHTHIYFYQSGW